MHPHLTPAQRGETLIGLLVGLALGLLALAGGAHMLAQLLRGHRQALQDSHLQQDLHFAMDLMVRELQGAHYVANAWKTRRPDACEDDFCQAGNFLLADNRIEFSLGRLPQPRLEPELVFTMKKKLRGPGVATEDVLDAIDKVYAGFEVIDSRYHDYSFALPDVVSDNASSALFIVGEVGIDAANIDLVNEHVAISKNGEFVYEATGEAVQGNPAYALALAVNELAERGQFVDAGAVVLTGGITDAVPIGPGDTISAVFSNLGTLSVTATR